MFRFIEETTSTNDDARTAQYVHGDVICAERQTAGRGQRGRKWESEQGCNLMFSMVLEPRFLAVRDQFLLSEAVALALVDTLARYDICARIKWTNDIYVGDRKMVGVLIEHNYSGSSLSRTIVGVGINVNQENFDPSLPNPVSMRLITGCEYDRREVLDTFYGFLMRRYAMLETDEKETLQEDYRRSMYRLGERHQFRLPDGQSVEGIIRGVRPSGELLVEYSDGITREYLFKEIEFVIAGR